MAACSADGLLGLGVGGVEDFQRHISLLVIASTLNPYQVHAKQTPTPAADEAAKLVMAPDRAKIASDGRDLSFIILTVADNSGQLVPRSTNSIHFEITGPGEIVATDNGDPTDMTAFPSPDRKAFDGMALAIVRAKKGGKGSITVTARSDGLKVATTKIVAQ